MEPFVGLIGPNVSCGVVCWAKPSLIAYEVQVPRSSLVTWRRDGRCVHLPVEGRVIDDLVRWSKCRTFGFLAGSCLVFRPDPLVDQLQTFLSVPVWHDFVSIGSCSVSEDFFHREAMGGLETTHKNGYWVRFDDLKPIASDHRRTLTRRS